jgi:D-methionine transport system substrate-binding protein
MMKKALSLGFIVFALAFTAACGGGAASNEPQPADNSGAGSEETATPVTIKVGASPEPHAKILEVVKEQLAEEGIELEIVEFTDYVQPNDQLYEKQLDANFFQHTPYLDSFNEEKGYDLVKVVGVHIEPIGAYSEKLEDIADLQDGAKVAIPNDATNGGRALALLESNGLIKLKEGVGINGTVHDVVENAKNIEFVEVEAATLPRILPDVDFAVINTNYALEAGLNPTKDALFIEDADSPYVNILAARPDNKDSEAIQKLAAALNSEAVKQFIEETYEGAIVPAFE